MQIALGNWTEVPLATVNDDAIVVAVGSANNIWYNSSSGIAYYFTGTWHPDTNSQSIAWISLGADGTRWCVSESGGAAFWFDIQWVDTFEVVLTQISVGNANLVWGVDVDGRLWQWVVTGTNWTSGSWQLLPGSDDYVFTNVSVASDGTAWAVAQGQQVLRWTGTDWEPMAGALDQVSVGSATNIWGITTAFGSATTYQWTGEGWNAFDQSLTNISAASDGTVFGIWSMGGGNLYRFERMGDLSISNPRLGQSTLDPGSSALYLFDVNNNSQVTTVNGLQLTPVYDAQAFAAAGLTVTPGTQPPPDLAPGESVEVGFTITAAATATSGTYGFSEVQASYSLSGISVPIDDNAAEGWMIFQVG